MSGLVLLLIYKKMEKNLEQFKNPYDSQYVAPYGYSFFNEEGKNIGRIIWRNNVKGVYLDECKEEWGL